MEHDVFREYPAEIGSNALAQLHGLAEQQQKAEAEVEQLEEALKLAKIKLSNIAEMQFPELMRDLGLTSFQTPGGLSVSLVTKIRSSISESNAEEAFRWLEDNGHGGIIKQKLMVDFSVDSKEISKVMDTVIEEVPDARISVKKSVHPSTLCAFISEQLSEGVNVPLRLFGAFHQQSTKISKGK